MGISPVLDIARRALLAQQTALGVVGHNIANVNTPGFSRQVPDFESEPGTQVGGGAVAGGGVRLTTVTQVVDPLLARRRLAAETDRGAVTARRDQLADLASIVNDLAEPSLRTALDGFFDAADALARNPAGGAERQALLGRAAALASALNGRGNGIAELQRSIDDRLGDLSQQVNADLDKVAALNRDIVRTELEGQRANDLRDQRQVLLNELASRLPLSTIENPDGAVTVASTSGVVLVQSGDVLHHLAERTGAPGLDGGVLHDLGFTGPNGTFLDVPQAFTGGEAGALLTVRDVDLVRAAGDVDTFAGALRDAANAIQTDPAARDLDGNATTTAPLFAGTGARDLQVVLTDPRRLGAALSTDPGDNTNALRLADLRTTAPEDVAVASPAAAALGRTSLASFLAGALGRVGQDAAQAQDVAAASDLRTQQLESQRAAISGVNLNEEMADLIKYQRAFQAAAQLLSVGNSVLDDLLHIL